MIWMVSEHPYALSGKLPPAEKQGSKAAFQTIRNRTFAKKRNTEK